MSSYSVIAYPAAVLSDDYSPMIYSKWLRSLRYGNDYFRLIDPAAYYPAYHRYVSNILKNGHAIIRIAALTDDHDVVLGFSVSRGTILEYVHVHQDYRRMGIGKNLVPPGMDTITHLTKTGKIIWKSKMKGVKFNPFI